MTIGLYVFAAVVFAFLIYCCVIIAWTVRMKQVAYLLQELLDGQWGDVMQMLKNEEYLEAVLTACKVVLEAIK